MSLILAFALKIKTNVESQILMRSLFNLISKRSRNQRKYY